MSVSISKKMITCSAASTAVQAAIGHAQQNGWAVAAIVVDASGHMLAAGRMDNAPAAVAGFALDKARTAVLGKSTQDFAKRMLSGPELQLGMVNRPNICAWEGGIPVHENGVLIGAIGVSGAAGPEDVQCAKAGLDAIGL